MFFDIYIYMECNYIYNVSFDMNLSITVFNCLQAVNDGIWTKRFECAINVSNFVSAWIIGWSSCRSRFVETLNIFKLTNRANSFGKKVNLFCEISSDRNLAILNNSFGNSSRFSCDRVHAPVLWAVSRWILLFLFPILHLNTRWLSSDTVMP